MPTKPVRGSVFIRLWNHLGPRRKKQFVFLSGLVGISAFVESATLGAVVPFLGILTKSELVFQYPVVREIARLVGISSASDMVFLLTGGFAILAIAAGVLRFAILRANIGFAYRVSHDFSVEVYRRALYQSYQIHVARNSNVVVSAVAKADASEGLFSWAITTLSAAVLAAAILIVLIAIDPSVAALVFIGFGACYGAISWGMRVRLRRNGKVIAQHQVLRLKALQDGLGGIRDVLLDGSQPIYSDLFRKTDLPYRRAVGDNAFIAQTPRYFMETLGMVLISVFAYVLSQKPGGLVVALPILAAFTLGALRLLPALQQIYNGWTYVVGHSPSLMDVLDFLDHPLPEEASGMIASPLSFQHEIRFQEVRFRYGENAPWVIDCLNLTIPRGARVGIVGSTGSGKSTVLDLLMALIEPTAGQILVDDKPLRNRSRSWQRTIAHVPQNVFLSDASFAENIAFGVSREAIDFVRVREAAQQAHIAEFIESGPEGYEAQVGERGNWLSGGQRQRIGIARALYKQASVILFDEATSALDNATELAVMEAIEGLGRDLTMVMIAHRLTTIRRCDLIIQLDDGRVVAQGTYDELICSSKSFSELAQARDLKPELPSRIVVP